jgi:hypothetical protein
MAVSKNILALGGNQFITQLDPSCPNIFLCFSEFYPCHQGGAGVQVTRPRSPEGGLRLNYTAYVLCFLGSIVISGLYELTLSD